MDETYSAQITVGPNEGGKEEVKRSENVGSRGS